MRRFLPYVAAFALLATSAAVQSRWTFRPAARGPKMPVEIFKQVPAKIGDWEGQDSSIDDRSLNMAEIDGYLLRRYRDRQGVGVTVMLVRGQPGPISVHTPEVCYGGSGYEQAAPLRKTPLDTGSSAHPAEFWVADMTKKGAVADETLQILYAWSTDGTWWASESPRLEFARYPKLFKLYFVHELSAAPGSEQAGKDDATPRFARQFLPELQKVLWPAPGPGGPLARAPRGRAGGLRTFVRG